MARDAGRTRRAWRSTSGDAGRSRGWIFLAAVAVAVVAAGGLWLLRPGDADVVSTGAGPSTSVGTDADPAPSTTTSTSPSPASSEPAAAYDVVELATLGGDTAWADDVNASGQVVGTSTTAGSVPGEPRFEAFLWDPATRVVQGLGAAGTVSGDSTATAINDSGVVVGWSGSFDCTVPVQCRATRWDTATGQVDDLGTLAGESTALDVGSTALGINATGEIVGQSTTVDGEHHAFLWEPETRTMRDLGTLGGAHSEAHAINDRGEVTGFSMTADGRMHAFVWTAESGMIDLGTGGDVSEGIDPGAIDAAGTVVGTHRDGSSGFIWRHDGRGFQDLGEVVPRDIGDAGLVVGARVGQGASSVTPVAVSARSGALVDLPGVDGFPQGSAAAVNDVGVVVGSVADGSSSLAVVWFPVDD